MTAAERAQRVRAHTVGAARIVRIVRVVDEPHTGHSAGRMVISGRMADVCAELDRLASCAAG